MVVKAWTDGACKGNPGIGGYGIIIIKPGEIIRLKGFKAYTTNNEMELTAVVVAITKILEDKKVNRIEIHSDSAYTINAINQKWLNHWKQNGWKTRAGLEVKNKELWKKLLILLKTNVKISFIKVKGHNGDINNEFADLLANQAIKEELECTTFPSELKGIETI